MIEVAHMDVQNPVCYMGMSLAESIMSPHT